MHEVHLIHCNYYLLLFVSLFQCNQKMCTIKAAQEISLANLNNFKLCMFLTRKADKSDAYV